MVARSQQAKAASAKQGKALCTKQAKACSTGKLQPVYIQLLSSKKNLLLFFLEKL